jgi:hypothetical protein
LLGGFCWLEGEGERSAVIDRAVGPGAAAVPVYDLAHAGQAYASARELAGGVQALECRE